MSTSYLDCLISKYIHHNINVNTYGILMNNNTQICAFKNHVITQKSVFKFNYSTSRDPQLTVLKEDRIKVILWTWTWTRNQHWDCQSVTVSVRLYTVVTVQCTILYEKKIVQGNQRVPGPFCKKYRKGYWASGESTAKSSWLATLRYVTQVLQEIAVRRKLKRRATLTKRQSRMWGSISLPWF